MKLKLLLTTLLATSIALIAFFWNKSEVRILYHTENDFGPIWVFEKKDERCMSFIKPPSPILQSCMSLENPKTAALFHYSQIFLGSLFLKENPEKILMIGLGGATVAKALNILVPNARLDIVEINPAIPPIVADYFEFRETQRNHIFVADGFEFVKNSPANIYDIVLLDAFTTDYIPPSFLTDEFMQNVKKIMAKDGIVAINTFANSKFQSLESELIKNNFGKYYNLTTNQTRVIMASNGNLAKLPEIIHRSNLWRYRFVEVGVDQTAMLSLFQDALR